MDATTDPIEANRIILGDCVEVMGTLSEVSVDMIFVDPPYNLQLDGELFRPNNTRVDGIEEAWDRFDDFEAYDRFTADWLRIASGAALKNGPPPVASQGH